MRKIITITAVILILSIMLSFAKNIVAKAVISAGVRAITGLKLSMDSMNIGIFKTLVGIRGLKLFNPANFPDRLMADMPEIYVDYDLGALLKKKVHLEKVKLNLKEFVVVKNKDGKLNLDSLKLSRGKKNEKTEVPELQIDVFELKIDRAVYKDYSKGHPPDVKEFYVGIDERYENITDLQAFTNLIVFKALANTTIARLVDFDLGVLKEQIGGTLMKAEKIAEKVTGKLVEVGEDLGINAKGAEEAVKKTTEAIKKILPVGGKEQY